MFVSKIDTAGTSIVKATSFDELYAILATCRIEHDTKIFVNRGPGSYSGIRVGLAYTLGLIHSGVIKEENVFGYTSFDISKYFVSNNTGIFLKAWPRAITNLGSIKGYIWKDNAVEYVNFADLSGTYTVLSEDSIEGMEGTKHTLVLHNGLAVPEVTTYFMQNIHTLTHDTSPLYGNPVNITTPKPNA